MTISAGKDCIGVVEVAAAKGVVDRGHERVNTVGGGKVLYPIARSKLPPLHLTALLAHIINYNL